MRLCGRRFLIGQRRNTEFQSVRPAEFYSDEIWLKEQRGESPLGAQACVPTNARNLRLFFRIFRVLERDAGAEQIAIAVNVVDSRYARPEFGIAQPWRGKGRLLA